MNAYITIAFNLVRLAVSSGLFDRVSSVVRNLIHSPMSGDEKKAMVKKFISDNGIELGGILLDLVIAITRARFENK